MKQHAHLNAVKKDVYEAADKEAVQLESVIDRLASENEAAGKSTIAAELAKERIITYESNREQSRVLYVTSDVKMFDAAYGRRRQLLELADVFDEIHILVLGNANKTAERERLASNVWVYGTQSRSFLWRLYDGVKRAAAELLFNEGFRADVIVALDPYEAAAVAAYLAERHGRPWQLHVSAEQASPDALGEHPWWRTRFTRYALKRAESVRTTSQVLADDVGRRYPKLTDIKVLPKYFSVQNLLDRPELRDDSLYAQFSFTIVAMGELRIDSVMYRALDAVAPLLQTPSIGLVIIGDGPLKRRLRERAELLGIERQVLFHSVVDDPMRHLASADVLLVTEQDEASDELVLQAAALGVPTVAAETSLRDDLFTDGVSAFLCDAEDVVAYTQKLRLLLNQSSYRSLLARNAPQVIRDRIEEDPLLYRYAYRRSVEAVLIDDRAEQPVVETADQAADSAPVAVDTVEVDGVEMKVPATQTAVDR